METYDIQVNDVFAIDVFISGNEVEGKTKESDARITIYKRVLDANFDLKTKNGRQFLNDIKTKFYDFCFSLNDCENDGVRSQGRKTWAFRVC